MSIMSTEQFARRLAQLRTEKGVSARDMSLSIGQCASYINNIENKNNLPSMLVFFYICEYLEITPAEFFDDGNPAPVRLNDIIEDLKRLDLHKLDNIARVIKDLLK